MKTMYKCVMVVIMVCWAIWAVAMTLPLVIGACRVAYRLIKGLCERVKRERKIIDVTCRTVV